MTKLSPPSYFCKKFPLRAKDQAFIQESRKAAKHIIDGSLKKIALIVGPCSIHDIESTLDYAKKLKVLSEKLQHFFVAMRVFVEKPRSSLGWKGLVSDPDLDGTSNIEKGLRVSRELLTELVKLKIPCALELLDPFVTPYLEDLISWGIIGARTSASQPHRVLASGLDFPVGFKNSVHGDVDIAIQGIKTARDSHTHISVHPSGDLYQKKTKGNPHTHLILRGGIQGSNYDEASVSCTEKALEKKGVSSQIFIDCSHGNSGKDHKTQKEVFLSSIETLRRTSVCGFLLESHLYSGRQEFCSDPIYGVSITDSCIGFEETEELLLWADEFLSPISMSSVQR